MSDESPVTEATEGLIAIRISEAIEAERRLIWRFIQGTISRYSGAVDPHYLAMRIRDGDYPR